jgi:EF-P beta-lysylation protein EpmB
MIARTIPRWQSELARAVSRPRDLLERLGLPADLAAQSPDFPLRVPESYVARIRPGDPADPLLRQVLPTAPEGKLATGYALDPVGDRAALVAPGLLRKYRGRALLIVTGACPVHCRYCFRRHFPYAGTGASRGAWDGALAALAADPSVDEVILSGGDPLSLADDRLATLVDRIAALPHVRRLRVHTRMPVVLPARVDDALLGWIAASRLRPVVVLHANHPHELDGEVAAAAARLAGAGATLLNQSVLLRGVNDEAATLAALSERLFDLGVLPYYLHQLDRVAGAAHFEVTDTRARELLTELRGRLPGYLVPRLVREEPGAPGKTPLDGV